MTLQVANTFTNQTADGILIVFAFNVETYDESWIKVYEDFVLSTQAYTVILNPDQGASPGGTITYTSFIPADDVVITMSREAPINQLIQYTPYTGFPAKTHEGGLDKGAAISQQLSDGLATAIKAPTFETTDMVLPKISDRALRTLSFDVDGNVITSNVFAVPVEFINCTVSINASQYNADPTGLTDSTAAIQSALDSGATHVVCCPGIYAIDTIYIPDNVFLDMKGASLTFFTASQSYGVVNMRGSTSFLGQNIKFRVDKMINMLRINIDEYKDVTIFDTVLDGVLRGIRYGKNTVTNDGFNLDNVTIKNATDGIAAQYTNQTSGINFNNVIMENCVGSVMNIYGSYGTITGGRMINNPIPVPTPVLNINACNGLTASGILFDGNGTSGLSDEIGIKTSKGVTISGNRLLATNPSEGRSTAIACSDSSEGININANYIKAEGNDDGNFTAITLSGGAKNGMVHSNVIENIQVGQNEYLVDFTLNYHIIDGVKQ